MIAAFLLVVFQGPVPEVDLSSDLGGVVALPIECCPIARVHKSPAEDAIFTVADETEPTQAREARQDEPSVKQDESDEDLLGGCILRTPVGEVPRDLYQVSDVIKTDEYRPFTKKLTACGIVLVAGDDVPDQFLQLVGTTIGEIFLPEGAVDRELQEDVLAHLYEYRALLPVPRTERSFERLIRSNPEAMEAIQLQNSVCDIIMAQVPAGQVMEVVEHILHSVTDVGLHYRFPAEWGISGESQLYKAMLEAIDLGYYDVSSYRDLKEDAPPEVYRRIILQEFAYWFISTAWDLQRDYGPEEEEWTIRTPRELKEKLPAFFAVYQRTAGKVMRPPSRSTLGEIGPTRSRVGRDVSERSVSDEAQAVDLDGRREYWEQERLHRSAGTIELPNIDTSGSRDGIVELPAEVPAIFREVFVRYTKVLAPNGQPIHLLAQKAWTNAQIVHARKVLEHILTDVPGTEFGSDKSPVANAMADTNAAMVLFDDVDAMERAFRGGLERVNLFMQDLRANECPSDGSADYLTHATRDAAFEEILHLVHDAGIRPVHPEYDLAIHRANLACAERDGWRGWPEDEPENHGNEYFAAIYDNYLDLWTRWPSVYEGRPISDLEEDDRERSSRRADSHFGAYPHGSRKALRENDPVGYAIVEKFFGPSLTYTLELPPDFDGTFSLRFDPSVAYSYKSQHLVSATLTGSRDAEIIGNAHDNTLTGNDGANQLAGRAGNDRIDGSGGGDTAIFRGSLDDYVIARVDGALTISDRQFGRDGTDTLTNVELFQFADQRVTLEQLVRDAK